MPAIKTTDEHRIAFLKAAENKVLKYQAEFWHEWDKKVNDFFGDKERKMQEHACTYGGFWLSKQEIGCLSEPLRLFFQKHMVKDGERYHLRGYSYYSADPLMYLTMHVPDDLSRWEGLREKWSEYKQLTVADYKSTSTIDFVEWIAMLSLFEYVFNDITTMCWTLEKWKEDNRYLNIGEIYENNLINLADSVASVISRLMVLKEEMTINTLLNELERVLQNESVEKILRWGETHLQACTGYVRAIREADSLPLIYGAYTTKLSKHITSKTNQVCLFSNAFGSLNCALVFKHLLKGTTEAKAYNVHYSQNRLDSDLFGSESKNVKIFGDDEAINIEKGQLSFVFDDCVFTGKTLRMIKEYLEARGSSVKLLPLSLDIQSLMYYKAPGKSEEELYADAKMAIEIAEEVGGVPPAFVAFWEWGKEKNRARDDDNTDYANVLNGGDLLLKVLWMRYRDSVLRPLNCNMGS